MAAVPVYPYGSLVSCDVAFFDVDTNMAFDPANVTFRVRNPAGTISTLVYPADPEVVKDATGVYHCDVDGSIAGSWWFDFRGDNPQAQNQQRFDIAPSFFP